MLSMQLGSTPPLASSMRQAKRSNASTVVVGFRSTDSNELGSSVPIRTSRSGPPEGSSYSLGKSLGRARAGSEGIQAARPVSSQLSIPKSATFVKVEGFQTPTDAQSPAASPPPSPQPKALGGASLLSRQLTTERLPVGLDDPSLLVQRLERAVSGGSPAVVLPSAPPARRISVPDDLLEQLQRQEACKVFREPLVTRAFSISCSAHDGQYRASGAPSFMHCVEVARQLAGMGANDVTVAAALLHDVLDDTLMWEDQLRGMMANDMVVDIVKQVSHLAYVSSKYRSHPATSAEAQQAMAKALVSMMVAMNSDPSALLIKLADRVHDMRTVGALPPATRNRLARETMDVWAPLANRLGVWKLKATLEDLAFRQLSPDAYHALQRVLDAAAAEEGLQPVVDDIRDALASKGVTAQELTARRKNVWGVYTKMQSKGYSLDRIHDVRGVRVIVETKEQCYTALRAIYTAFEVDPSREKNYIRHPKPNNYQSLHAVVRAKDGHWVEVQIRTKAMHYLAEFGKDAAHWTYKEGGGKGALRGASLDDGQEARWAKFNASQQVSDHKCRPSGSPPQGQWLEMIVASTSAGAAPAARLQPVAGGRRSSSPSPKRDFIEYLRWSEQALAPHSAERELVCLVSAGGMDVRSVPKGTTLGDLLAGVGPAAAAPDAHVLVNKQLEGSSRKLLLRTGDIVEVYCPEGAEAPATFLSPALSTGVEMPSSLAAAPQSPRRPTPPPAPQPLSPVAPAMAPAGNVVPLGSLSSKLRVKAAAVRAS